jgi:hypothetical protein
MLKTLLAAVAAAVLLHAAPALACPCNECPRREVAQAEKQEKKEMPKGCACEKECKCGDKCTCPGHKHAKPEEKKS